MNQILYFAILCFFSLSFYAQGIEKNEVMEITLPSPANEKTPKNLYLEELLTTAFARENFNLKLNYSKVRMNQSRSTQSLISGEIIDLTWLPYTSERANQLLAVKIPLYKGLHGTRLLIVNKNNLRKFAGIRTLKELELLTGVQHYSWADYDVLVNNQLNVKSDLSYLGMFKAVSYEVVDYFPRSSLTIMDEVKSKEDLKLMIEPTLLLKYPSYLNFFVSKKTPELAEIIRSGLNKMIKDGSFETTFDKYIGSKVNQLNLEERHKIELRNDSVKLQKIY